MLGLENIDRSRHAGSIGRKWLPINSNGLPRLNQFSIAQDAKRIRNGKRIRGIMRNNQAGRCLRIRAIIPDQIEQ